MDIATGPPLKKIKLNDESAAEASRHPTASESRQQKLKRLFEVSSSIGSRSPQDVIQITHSWLDNLISESSSQVSGAILTQISRWISTFEFIDPRPIVDAMMKLDQVHPKWKLDIITAMYSIAQSREIVRDSVVSWAQSQLFFPATSRTDAAPNIFLPPSESSPLVKAMALKIIGSVFSPKFVAAASQVQQICADFASDADARVRLSALQALLKMHESKFYVEFKHYRIAVVALTDDDEFVRAAALRLVWNLAITYQNQNVATVQQQQQRVIPLADDAFLKICSMATDTAIPIRVEACELLGTLQGVSSQLLHQALSKKMVKVDIVPKAASGGTPGKDKIKSTEEGEMDADALAAGEVDVIQVSAAAALIESGSYGALIHALEDEFAEVRCAAVKTIASLSLRSEEFAAQSLEFLVDMFNDENELVRVMTISSLERFGERARLAFPQIQHMLALLGDQSSALRESVRSFLASDKQQLPEAAALVASVNTLLHNLLMYPVDFVSIFNTLMKIGSRHPIYVELSLDKLLPEIYLHPPLQRHIDELEYQAILVVVFNAIQHRPTLLSVLPLNFQNHYSIMRDRHPSFVPCIESLEIWAPQQLIVREHLKRLHSADPVAPEFNNIHNRDGLLAELSSCSRYVRQALLLTKGVALDPSVEHRGLILYGSVTSRLQRVTDVIQRKNEAVSHLSDSLVVEDTMEVLPFAMWNIADILRDFLGLTVALADASATVPVAEWTKKIIHKTYVLQALFTNLPTNIHTMLYRWRLHAHLAVVFDLVVRYKGKVAPLSLDTAIATLQRRLRSDIVPPPVARVIQDLSVNPEDLLSDLDQILSFKMSCWDVLYWPFEPLQESDWKPVRHIFAKLTSPLSNPHHPVEFIPGLPFELKIVGSVSGVANLDRILLRLRSPTGKVQIISPSVDVAETKKLLPFSHTVLVQEQNWPKGSHLEVDVVIETETDLSAGDAASQIFPSSDWESSKELISLLGDNSKVFASSRRSFPSIRT